MLSLSVFPLPLRFLSSASLPVLATQPLFLPFLFLPASASQWLVRCCLSAFRLPCFSASAPPGFPCFASASSYSAFCSFPFILPGFAPTAVPPVLPFRPLPLVRFPSGLFPRFAFFRPLPLGSDYSAFRLSFPFFPFSPVGGSFGAASQPCGLLAFPLPYGLLPCRPSDFGTQLTALPFSLRCLASQWLPQRLGLLPFGSQPLSPGFRFRFWLLSFGKYPLQIPPSRFVFVFSQRPHVY